MYSTETIQKAPTTETIKDIMIVSNTHIINKYTKNLINKNIIFHICKTNDNNEIIINKN